VAVCLGLWRHCREWRYGDGLLRSVWSAFIVSAGSWT